MIGQLLLYARTVRSLRWQQIAFRAMRRRPLRRDRLSDGEPLDVNVLHQFGLRLREWGPDDLPSRISRAQAVCEGRFSFLGKEMRFSSPDWTSRHVSHLWTFNLHYFDYATDLAWAFRDTGETKFARAFVALALDWIRHTSDERGDAWQPYTVSTRIVNWVVALALLQESLSTEELEALASSVHRQLVWLSSRLEEHLQGNHLQRNITAICTVGVMFSGRKSRSVVSRALPRLWHELLDQTFADGGHAERSPMYLALALSDCLLATAALDVSDHSIPDDASRRIAAMSGALQLLSRPDGTLYRFHDAADGVAPATEWLATVARRQVGGPTVRLGGTVGVWDLSRSGYFGCRTGAHSIVIDAGPPGPAHLPAHAHCSLLSFELDWEGAPFVVDSGVGGYADDPLREYYRSTRAHNTVTIDGWDQSEIWSVFRMARRATPIAAEIHADERGFAFSGSYRPYHSRRLVHERHIEGAPGSWIISDCVRGGSSGRIVSFLHFHPSWSVSVTQRGVIAERGNRSVFIETFGIAALRLVFGERSPSQGWYAARFGEVVPGAAVEMTVSCPSRFGYSILDRGEPT